MGSFSVWHWLVVLTFVGIPVWLLVRSARRKPDKGFAGWLALLVFGQTIAPLKVLATFIQNLEGYNNLAGLKNATTVIVGETALNLIFLAIVFITTVVMWQKRASFRRWFLVQWLAAPIVFFVDIVMVSALFNLAPSELGVQAAVQTLVAFLLGGVWVAYVFMSRRVQNTFGPMIETPTRAALYGSEANSSLVQSEKPS